MSIGEHIRAERKKAGLTQAQLAKVCGLSSGTIRQYESNRRQPRIEQLQMIADSLGIPMTNLLEDSPADTSTGSRFIGRLETAFYKLNDKGQQIATERVEELTRIPEYKQQTEDTEQETSGE